ncbi:helix-turn-helix transcriptional regulator [Saccharopolyspora sp. WRP15-2]|uniref:Helix-turn-helix transcriptional regulator n=1 Tax=Saccharopolyspora oryzae TaxID=2997343 RepID=A0ABT4V8C0_9PSEU|nr:helix-turn-helix transcriptional regulator [Saccharopolyspora oryzae]MDA3630215.1 helix-turn-helix transcriptional regulator [Saccharopolyspora oryzae]
MSSELRELRLRSGLAAEEVAGALGFSMSKLSRIENGQRGLYADDVAALLGLYRVPAERRETLLTLVRTASSPNWWQVQDGRLPAMWEDVIRFEKEAVALYNYETMLIPGLLQTSEYATAIVQGTDPDLNLAEVDTLVTARMGRQMLLNRPTAPTLEVLIEQSILERPAGGSGVMFRQLRHLVSATSQDNVTLRVLPTELGVHPGMAGPFVILDFEKQPSLVYLENRGSSAFLEESEHVAAAKEALEALQGMALSVKDSVDLINSIADRLV